MNNPITEALQHLRTHGWRQISMVDLEGRVCSLGALNKTTVDALFAREGCRIDLSTSAEVAPYLVKIIEAQYPEWYKENLDQFEYHVFRSQLTRDERVVYKWNDVLDRTQNEVEVVFEKAAILWEEING